MRITVQDVERYFDDCVNLNDYDLGGCEITEDDYEIIAQKANEDGVDLELAVDDYLYGVREILDEGLEDLEE